MRLGINYHLFNLEWSERERSAKDQGSNSTQAQIYMPLRLLESILISQLKYSDIMPCTKLNLGDSFYIIQAKIYI